MIESIIAIIHSHPPRVHCRHPDCDSFSGPMDKYQGFAGNFRQGESCHHARLCSSCCTRYLASMVQDFSSNDLYGATTAVFLMKPCYNPSNLRKNPTPFLSLQDTHTANKILFLEVGRVWSGEIDERYLFRRLDTRGTQEERDGLYDSAVHVLPFRDRGGRRVLLWLGTPDTPRPLHELQRRGIYAGSSHGRDGENQRKGMCHVFYFLGHQFDARRMFKHREVNRLISRLLESNPHRNAVLHFCYCSASWRPFVSTFRMSVNLFTGLRVVVREL